MPHTIFYSWQNDTPPNVNRSFIKEALERAIKDVAQDMSVEEPIRLDHDTKGVPGNPPIADTILQKIDACGIFVPDLTYVARTTKDKCTPNPNVLVELGYARKSLGPSRTIFVMNEAFGKFDEGMPFDLLYLRKPICYTLPTDATTDTKRQVRDTFVKDLAFAIRNIIESNAIGSAQQQRPSLALYFSEAHERIDDIFSKDRRNDRTPVRYVSFNFLVENTSNVPVTDITVGVIAWSFSNGENLAPVIDSLRSQLEVIPEQSGFYRRLTLQHYTGKDESNLDPFRQLGIRSIGPYCFPHDLASAKVTCAVYLRAQDISLMWFQLDFDYLSRFESAFQNPSSPKYTLIPKGQGRPRVSWEKAG